MEMNWSEFMKWMQETGYFSTIKVYDTIVFAYIKKETSLNREVISNILDGAGEHFESISLSEKGVFFHRPIS